MKKDGINFVFDTIICYSLLKKKRERVNSTIRESREKLSRAREHVGRDKELATPIRVLRPNARRYIHAESGALRALQLQLYASISDICPKCRITGQLSKSTDQFSHE